MGTFRLYYVRGSGDTRDTTLIEGFLPAPMPSEALASVALNAVPNYDVVVQPSSVTADIDLRRAGYVYLTRNEVGEIDGGVRWGSSTFPERHDGLFRGTGYAFTFPPLWENTAVSPRLEVRDDEDETSVLGELALPVTASPSWLQPVTLPTVPEDTRLTFSADLTFSDPGLVPVLVFPNTFGEVGWGADVLEVDDFGVRRREREGTTDLGTPYKVWAPHNDETRGEAYLVMVRL